MFGAELDNLRRAVKALVSRHPIALAKLSFNFKMSSIQHWIRALSGREGKQKQALVLNKD